MVNSDSRLDALFSALADPTRRAILASLSEGPKTVGDLAEPFEMSLAAVSKHLRVLDSVGLVGRNRQGRHIICVLRPKSLKRAADWIDDYETFWSDRLAAMDTAIKKNKRSAS